LDHVRRDHDDDVGWSFVLIAIDVTVVWALTLHGRDITME